MKFQEQLPVLIGKHMMIFRN